MAEVGIAAVGVLMSAAVLVEWADNKLKLEERLRQQELEKLRMEQAQAADLAFQKLAELFVSQILMAALMIGVCAIMLFVGLIGLRVFWTSSRHAAHKQQQEMVETLRTSVGAKAAAGIMLLGKSGTGKSSFLNTISSALASAHVQQAGVSSRISTRSFTSSVRLHTVRHDHRFAQWSVADTPGAIFEEVLSLYGRMLSSCMQQQAYDDKVRAVLLSPMQQLSRHTRIGCVLVVLAADEVWEAAQANKEAEDMPLAIPKGHIMWELCQVAKDLHAKLEGKSVRMGCVITKLDTVQPAPASDTRGMPWSRLARIWKPEAHMPQCTGSGLEASAPAQRLRQLVASETGVPKNMVFPLVNAVAVEDLPEHLGLQYQALRCASECLDTARAANDEAAQATGSLRDCSSGSDMEG